MNELGKWADMSNRYIKLSEVIDTIVNVLEHTDCKDEHIDEVLNAIGELPTIEVSEDAVSRKWLEDNAEIFSQGLYDESMWAVPFSILENAPSVVPSRPTGKWIKDEDGVYHTCSNCGCQWTFIDDSDGSPFCPECGADMRGDTNADSN